MEIAETFREFSWKYWAVDPPFVNRQAVLGELVDVGHFLANALVAVGVTDDEWEAAYRAKQQVNRERQASRTYSAVKR